MSEALSMSSCDSDPRAGKVTVFYFLRGERERKKIKMCRQDAELWIDFYNHLCFLAFSGNYKHTVLWRPCCNQSVCVCVCVSICEEIVAILSRK